MNRLAIVCGFPNNPEIKLPKSSWEQGNITEYCESVSDCNKSLFFLSLSSFIFHLFLTIALTCPKLNYTVDLVNAGKCYYIHKESICLAHTHFVSNDALEA